jgi:recombinational DNA repair protein (RecF pathway)
MAEKIEGILLSRVQHTSGAFVVTFLTENEGLKSFYFRGGQKKGGTVFPLAHGTIIFTQRTASGMPSMSGFELIGNSGFTSDPRRVSIAFFLSELITRCTAAENPDARLYQTLRSITELLSSEVSVKNLPLRCLVEIMLPLGISPTLEATHGPLVFDLAEGTIRKGTSSERTPGGEEITLIAAQMGLENVIAPSQEIAQRALNVLLLYYKQHFPGIERLKTLEVLRETMA